MTNATSSLIPLTLRARIVAIVGASSGSVVEWFDFYVDSFCALYFSWRGRCRTQARPAC